jgi:hypothetical protein
MLKKYKFLVNKVESSPLKVLPFFAGKSDRGKLNFLEELRVYIYDFRKEGEDPSAGTIDRSEIRK